MPWRLCRAASGMGQCTPQSLLLFLQHPVHLTQLRPRAGVDNVGVTARSMSNSWMRPWTMPASGAACSSGSASLCGELLDLIEPSGLRQYLPEITRGVTFSVSGPHWPPGGLQNVRGITFRQARQLRCVPCFHLEHREFPVQPARRLFGAAFFVTTCPAGAGAQRFFAGSPCG
jgi:hypothetical protein